MGACVSREANVPDENEQSPGGPNATNPIDSLQQDPKILLLGSSNSGKTTVLKQLSACWDGGTRVLPGTDSELRELVFFSLIKGIRAALTIIEDLDLDTFDLRDTLAHQVEDEPATRAFRDREPFPALYHLPIKRLCEALLAHRVHYRAQSGFPDNLLYFYRHLDRLFSGVYVPTAGDIAHAYVMTTGMTKSFVPLDSGDRRRGDFCLVDVGGRKSERRKWMHAFQNVSAIVFVVNLRGYSRSLAEDPSVNEMSDAMDLWEAIAHSRLFEETPLILLLNKNDLFGDAIQHVDIRDHFPDYDGDPRDVEDARRYFLRRFFDLMPKYAQSPTRKTDEEGELCTAISPPLLMLPRWSPCSRPSKASSCRRRT